MLCKKRETNYRDVFFQTASVVKRHKRIAMKAIRFHRSEGIKCTQNVAANMSSFFRVIDQPAVP